jgi:pantetheine-phosphate adenylyltransferase
MQTILKALSWLPARSHAITRRGICHAPCRNNIALFAGTFDPPTLGHKDTITRASTLFNKLIVCVAINTSKSPFLPVEKRVNLLKEICRDLDNVSVVAHEGLLAKYALENDVNVFVRGMRDVKDFDTEYPLFVANQELCHIDTVFLLCAPRYRHISSSLVREIYRMNGPLESFVPKEVVDGLR